MSPKSLFCVSPLWPKKLKTNKTLWNNIIIFVSNCSQPIYKTFPCTFFSWDLKQKFLDLLILAPCTKFTWTYYMNPWITQQHITMSVCCPETSHNTLAKEECFRCTHQLILTPWVGALSWSLSLKQSVVRSCKSRGGMGQAEAKTQAERIHIKQRMAVRPLTTPLESCVTKFSI